MARVHVRPGELEHGQESEQIPLQVVSGNYFSLLGAQPALGRAFLPDEDAQPTPVAVAQPRLLGAQPRIAIPRSSARR